NLSNEDIGTADSLDLRKEIKEFTLPYSFDLAENETEKLTYRFNGRFYLLGIDQDVYFNEEPIPDRSKEQFIGGYNEFEVE
ncbi:Solitary outer membrane autotransporter beta-barrel domain, partial [Vibrio parahaemolyticus]